MNLNKKKTAQRQFKSFTLRTIVFSLNKPFICIFRIIIHYKNFFDHYEWDIIEILSSLNRKYGHQGDYCKTKQNKIKIKKKKRKLRIPWMTASSIDKIRPVPSCGNYFTCRSRGLAIKKDVFGKLMFSKFLLVFGSNKTSFFLPSWGYFSITIM